MMFPFNGFMGGFGILGFVFMVLFWGFIIWVVLYFMKSATDSSKPPIDQNKKPLDILEERYAKGEIDKKEFDEKKKDLE